MKKITLNNKEYLLEEKAYSELDNYIAAIEQYFESDKEAKEDILAAIADLADERLARKETKKIDSSDVKKILHTLGSLEQITESQIQEPQITATKKLYRDKQVGWIGGVAAGIAVYFDVPVWLIRLGFIVTMFTPFPMILVYLLMWYIIPPAITKSDRLKMYGKSVSLTTLSQDDNYTKNRIINFAKFIGILVGIMALISVAIISIGLLAHIRFSVLQDDIYIQQPDGSTIKADTIINKQDLSFTCSDGTIGTFSTTNFNDKNAERAAYLILNDSVIPMNYIASGSGEKYENTSESLVFWEKGDIAFIEKEGSIIHSDCELSSRTQGNFVTIIVPDLDVPVTIGNPDIITSFDGGSVLLKTEFMTVISKVSADADYYAIPFVVTLEGGGSLYYLGLFEEYENGYIHHNSYLLGDRIKIQSLHDEIQAVSVHYFDYAEGQSFSEEPTAKKQMTIGIQTRSQFIKISE